MPTLEFKGKASVYAHHLSVPFRELVPVAEKSLPASGAKPSLDDNLIIHGDNLEALKALLPRYAGKVDVIYIDPPYNTGKEGWAYNDNVNSPLMKGWLGKAVDREDLERHDKWLCMMWPRLELLQELLTDDGVLFVSIDDNEVHRLRLTMDEVLGEGSFLAMFVWKSRKFPDSRAVTGISTDHEYILAYQKGEGAFRGVERDQTKFQNPDNDHRGPWMSRSMLGLATSSQRPNLHFPIVDPSTGIEFAPPANRGWRYSRDRLQGMIAEGRVLFPAKADGRPREKKFQGELQNEFVAFPTIIDDVFTSDGTAELREIFGSQVFDFPKPSALIAKLIAQVAEDGAVVLDSFAGSGSTAHASLTLATNGGGNDLRFILVETEDYADTLTAERVRRVINGVPQAKDEALRNGLGGSFTYCDLGEPIDLERFFQGKAAPPYAQVARYIAYTATGLSIPNAPEAPDDLWFVGEVGGYRIHLIYKPDLAWMKSDAAALTEELARRIAKAAGGKEALVYGAQKFIGQKALKQIGVTFCQMPYSIYRILGNGDDA